jgi:RimJ/RimL family protein N-acetyltransferase
MSSERLSDDVVALREWDLGDAEWYAATAATDELIQRFTTESPTVTALEVRTAILELRAGQSGAVGFLVADAVTGERLGNIALSHEDGVGHVSYWVADGARGRGVATRAVRILARWAFATLGLVELRLWAHVDNIASRTVAERAGFVRDPDRDEPKHIKGRVWPGAAYAVRRAPD